MEANRSTDEDGSPLEQAKALALRGELSEAFKALTNAPDGLAAVNAHGELASWLYNSQKDPGAMLACGKAGIRLGLMNADRLDAENQEPGVRLKSAIQTLANNVAANCWPGWGDAGIVLTTDHVREGLALAKTSLSISQALGLDQRIPTAHWLIGALQFAAGEQEEALASFDLAEQGFQQAAKQVEALMARGYRFILMKRSPATAGEAAVELDRVLAILSEDGSKPALFFASQLRTADALL